MFYNTKYGNFSDAMDKPDGVAVVGAFFEVSEKQQGFVVTLLCMERNVMEYF